MNWRNLIHDYFNYTRKDRIGILLLVVLVLIVYWLPGLVRPHGSIALTAKDSAWLAAMGDWEKRQDSSFDKREQNNYPDAASGDRGFPVHDRQAPELFYFDPNTLEASGFARLGIGQRTVRTILRYREKGGVFRKPGDLGKIYGLDPEEVARLVPFVRFEKRDPESPSRQTYPSSPPAKTYQPEIIDINAADSAQLVRLPGIGPRLSARIIRFREKLGGFHTVDQLAETYGLPDSTFQQLRPRLLLERGKTRKININKADRDSLWGHPYISRSLANLIVSFRKEHGDFASVDELGKLVLVNDSMLRKLRPYLTVE